MPGSGWRQSSSAKRGNCERSARLRGCHFFSMVEKPRSAKLGPRARRMPSTIVVLLQETRVPGGLGKSKRRDDRDELGRGRFMRGLLQGVPDRRPGGRRSPPFARAGKPGTGGGTCRSVLGRVGGSRLGSAPGRGRLKSQLPPATGDSGRAGLDDSGGPESRSDEDAENRRAERGAGSGE